MKSIRTILIGLAILAAVPLWAQIGQGSGNGQSGASGPNPRTGIVSTPLSDAEAEFLLHLREEEKLARDVYEALYAKWGYVVFSNIAESEQRHFDAMGNLISKYGLKDPASAVRGSFENEALQVFYNQLVAQGYVSLVDALKSGVAIEATDIRDLGAALKATDNMDVLSVYANLLRGSKRHLSAFESHLEILGAN